MVGVVSNEMVQGNVENGCSYLPHFFYMTKTFNVGSSYSIKVNRDNHRFMCYFMAFIVCIRGFYYTRKVITVDDTYLHAKYEDVLLSFVVQDKKNHVYAITFCVVGKENDASWTLFF